MQSSYAFSFIESPAMLATGILWTRKGAELILSQHKKVKYPMITI